MWIAVGVSPSAGVPQGHLWYPTLIVQAIRETAEADIEALKLHREETEKELKEWHARRRRQERRAAERAAERLATEKQQVLHLAEMARQRREEELRWEAEELRKQEEIVRHSQSQLEASLQIEAERERHRCAVAEIAQQRRELQRRQQQDNAHRRTDAARAIQRVYRGFVGRGTAWVERCRVQAVRARAAVRLQALARGVVTRARMLEALYAMVAIQRVFRGHMARRQARELRRELAQKRIAAWRFLRIWRMRRAAAAGAPSVGAAVAAPLVAALKSAANAVERPPSPPVCRRLSLPPGGPHTPPGAQSPPSPRAHAAPCPDTAPPRPPPAGLEPDAPDAKAASTTAPPMPDPMSMSSPPRPLGLEGLSAPLARVPSPVSTADHDTLPTSPLLADARGDGSPLSPAAPGTPAHAPASPLSGVSLSAFTPSPGLPPFATHPTALSPVADPAGRPNPLNPPRLELPPVVVSQKWVRPKQLRGGGGGGGGGERLFTKSVRQSLERVLMRDLKYGRPDPLASTMPMAGKPPREHNLLSQTLPLPGRAQREQLLASSPTAADLRASISAPGEPSGPGPGLRLPSLTPEPVRTVPEAASAPERSSPPEPLLPASAETYALRLMQVHSNTPVLDGYGGLVRNHGGWKPLNTAVRGCGRLEGFWRAASVRLGFQQCSISISTKKMEPSRPWFQMVVETARAVWVERLGGWVVREWVRCTHGVWEGGDPEEWGKVWREIARVGNFSTGCVRFCRVAKGCGGGCEGCDSRE